MMAMPILSRVVRQTPLRWYLPNKIVRQELIQLAIDRLAARTYVEIGVDEGQSFCAVNVPTKIGIDPVPAFPAVERELSKPGVFYQAMTSDHFFATTARQTLADGIDVAFVDGLHTYGQTFRDLSNCLEHLNPGGIILVHDCLPTSAEEARVAETYDEACRLNGPSWNGLWTGDGWKAIAALRAQRPDVVANVINCDHGVGVVYRGTNDAGVSLTQAAIDGLSYQDLAGRTAELIGLRRPIHLLSALGRLRELRRPLSGDHPRRIS